MPFLTKSQRSWHTSGFVGENEKMKEVFAEVSDYPATFKGDAVNVLLAAAAYNLKSIMRVFFVAYKKYQREVRFYKLHA